MNAKRWKLLCYVIYIAMQGTFLPIVIKYQHATDTGDGHLATLFFIIYEVLIVVDGVLAIKLFSKD
jgi:hypothetical protein